MRVTQTLDMCRIFWVTGLCVPEWVLNFLFQTSVISSRVCRVHDTNTSGFGGVDLKCLQADMLGADVELAARDDGVISSEAPSGPLLGATQPSLLTSAVPEMWLLPRLPKGTS